MLRNNTTTYLDISSEILKAALPRDDIWFSFENNLAWEVTSKWQLDNWLVPHLATAGYLLSIGLISRCMKTRPSLLLKYPLIVWNLLLAAFSIMFVVRTAPIVAEKFFTIGFHSTVCDTSVEQSSPVASAWAFLFVLSKPAEFGDTVFILLRKRPLIFLHYYHHVTVFYMTWYGTVTFESISVWFALVNGFVHSVMYVYYTVRSLGLRVPRGVAMIVTTIQLSQMVWGIGIVGFAYYAKHYTPFGCEVGRFYLNSSFCIYLSYFVLFAKLFYEAYLKGPSKDKKGHLKDAIKDEVKLFKASSKDKML